MHVKNYFSENYDYVFIDKLQLSCHVGCTEEERAFPQIINISVKAFKNLASAGATDNIYDSIDYASATEQIKLALHNKRFSLIEKIAETISTVLIDKFPVEAVQVQIQKKVFPDVEAFGVSIFREKK